MKYQDDVAAQRNLAGSYGLGFVSSFNTASPYAAAIDHCSQYSSESRGFKCPSALLEGLDESRLYGATPDWYAEGSFGSTAIQSASQSFPRSNGYCTEPMQGYDAMSSGTGPVDTTYTGPEHQSAHNYPSEFPSLLYSAWNGNMYTVANEQLPFAPALGSQHPSTSAEKVKKGYSCFHPKCGKVVSRASDLARHYQSIHNRETTFHCSEPACKYHEEKGFSRYDKLLSHQRNAHGVRRDEQLSKLEYRRHEFSLLPKDEQNRRVKRLAQTLGIRDLPEYELLLKSRAEKGFLSRAEYELLLKE